MGRDRQPPADGIAPRPAPGERGRPGRRDDVRQLSAPLARLWRTPPWTGAKHADKTAHTVDDLLLHLRAADALVWGGDWNHALSGREYAGSLGGRKVVLDAVDQLDLSVPTADLPHPIDGLLSIDHVAVPRGTATTASRTPAERDGTRLSDHDAYVVEVFTASAVE